MAKKNKAGRPSKLLTLEPIEGGIERLYQGIGDDDEVDDSALTTTYQWLSQAMRCTVGAVKANIDKGHLGPVISIIGSKVVILHGHRSVSRYNNDRHPRDGYISMTEIIALRMIDSTMFDSRKFVLVRFYAHKGAKALADEIIANEIENNTDRANPFQFQWWKYKKGTAEFKAAYKKRFNLFYNELIGKRILVRKDFKPTAGIDMVKQLELPPAILDTLNGRLTVEQASYFVGEWESYVDNHANDMQLPAIKFRVSQMILEQINIQELRDIKIMSATKLDDLDAEISKSIARYDKLTPLHFLKHTPASKPTKAESENGQAEPAEEPLGDGSEVGGKGFDKGSL